MPGAFLGEKGIFEDVAHPEYLSSFRTSVPSRQRKGPSSVLANSSQLVNTFGGNVPSSIALCRSSIDIVSWMFDVFVVLVDFDVFGVFVLVFDC